MFALGKSGLKRQQQAAAALAAEKAAAEEAEADIAVPTGAGAT
jgi:hypothetical protein